MWPPEDTALISRRQLARLGPDGAEDHVEGLSVLAVLITDQVTRGPQGTILLCSRNNMLDNFPTICPLW
jgi:hypothetical protein